MGSAIPVEGIAEKCTALVLAGGRGRRVGGEDKGLLNVLGRPLIEHVLDRIQPQVDQILINANRNFGFYERYGYRVFTDDEPGFGGPLAGLASARTLISTPYLQVLACDMPFIPLDLTQRLYRALVSAQVSLAYPHANERDHPSTLFMTTSLLDELPKFLAEGRNRLTDWCQSNRSIKVMFDEALAFTNLNTLESIQNLETKVG